VTILSEAAWRLFLVAVLCWMLRPHRPVSDGQEVMGPRFPLLDAAGVARRDWGTATDNPPTALGRVYVCGDVSSHVGEALAPEHAIEFES
jgi:hypothetical protein